MTTIDLNETVLDAPRPERGSPIGRLFRRWDEKRQQRRTLSELSHMPVHLLRDMGIEPADVYDALEGRRSSVLLTRSADRSKASLAPPAMRQ